MTIERLIQRIEHLLLLPTLLSSFSSLSSSSVTAIPSSIRGSDDTLLPPTDPTPPRYGVDITFPQHYYNGISTNYAWLPHNTDPENNPTPPEYEGMPIQPLPGRKENYDEFMEGCRKYYDESFCKSQEEERIYTSTHQTQIMKNFTDNGFKKIRLPSDLFSRITTFWEMNKSAPRREGDNPYVNFWLSPPYMVSFEDPNAKWTAETQNIQHQIFDVTQPIIEEWTGLELQRYAVYGIRVYYNESILTPHVDDLPRVASAIVNVDQDLEEPWPLEVIGHDGIAYNVTMEPGDMVLYESHSCFHGRPFKMNGKFFANVFIHFYPTGNDVNGNPIISDVYEGAPVYVAGGKWEVQSGRHWAIRFPMKRGDDDPDDPVIYTNNTPEDEIEGDDGTFREDDTFDEGDTDNLNRNSAHEHAIVGDITALSQLAADENLKHLLFQEDNNGWQPIHEAARWGHVDVLELLLEHGADINAVTSSEGGSVLYWALSEFEEEDHPMIDFLVGKGALNIDLEEL